MRKIYKIKPSLLSSYGTKCEHCLWMSVREVWGQKSLNLRMNGHLSSQIENLLHGKQTEQLMPELGKGEIVDKGGLVCSHKLPLDSVADFYIAGEYDHLVKLEDGTYAVSDVKTTAGKEEKFTPEYISGIYANQVRAYAYSLENPGDREWLGFLKQVKRKNNSKKPRDEEQHPNYGGKVPQYGGRYSEEKIPVTRLGLNSFKYSYSSLNQDGNVTIKSERLWTEVEKNYKALLDYCQKFADIVTQDSPPPPPNTNLKYVEGKDCQFCWDYMKHATRR